MFIMFFAGGSDPNLPELPFELVPNRSYSYTAFVWWKKHYRYLYGPKIVQTADLWPAGRPDGRVDLRDWAVFANNWLKVK